MTDDVRELRLMLTTEHDCSYIEGERARTLFVDPDARLTPELYSSLARMGFRRSGRYVYRPHCAACAACIPVRVPAATFVWRRRHRRIWRHNRDLAVHIRSPEDLDEYYQLYARYIEARHADGDMYPPSRQQFRDFLICEWMETWFVEFRDTQQQLLAVAVVDRVDDGLSALYTFFEPEAERRALGVYAVLWQLERARQQELPFLYLGYWVRECQKMRYKADYRPLQMMLGDRWVDLR